MRRDADEYFKQKNREMLTPNLSGTRDGSNCVTISFPKEDTSEHHDK